MNRIIRRTVKAAVLLSEAQPLYVSLVKHGANQTPFKSLKSDNPADTMTKNSTVKKGLNIESGVEINRMTFKSDKFADEKAVKSYMDEQGFSNYLVEKTEEGFSVAGVDVTEFEGGNDGIASIKVDEDGVEVFVGKLKSAVEDEKKQKTGEGTAPNTAKPAETPAAKTEAAATTTTTTAEVPPARTRETPAPAAKTEAAKPGETPTPAPEKPAAKAATAAATKTEEAPVFLKSVKGDGIVQKWDYYCNMCSTGRTLSEVMADALEDGIPLGYDQVIASFTLAIANNLKEGNTAAISGLVSELGAYLNKLATLSASETKSEVKEALLPKAQKQSASEPTPKTDAAKKTETNPANAEAAYETRLKTLEEMVATLATKEAVTGLTTKMDEVRGSVTKLQQVRQTRKSAAAGDLPPAEPVKKGDAAPATDLNKLSKSERNLLGLRPE